MLNEYPGLEAFERTIVRTRQELGWVHQSAQYCQLTRDANKHIRLEWAHQMIASKEMVDDVTSQMNQHFWWNTMCVGLIGVLERYGIL